MRYFSLLHLMRVITCGLIAAISMGHAMQERQVSIQHILMLKDNDEARTLLTSNPERHAQLFTHLLTNPDTLLKRNVLLLQEVTDTCAAQFPHMLKIHSKDDIMRIKKLIERLDALEKVCCSRASGLSHEQERICDDLGTLPVHIADARLSERLRPLERKCGKRSYQEDIIYSLRERFTSLLEQASAPITADNHHQ